MNRSLAISLVAAFALSACSGGSSSSFPASPTTTQGIQITHTQSGRVIEFSVTTPRGTLPVRETTTIAHTSLGDDTSVLVQAGSVSYTVDFAQNTAANKTSITYTDSNGKQTVTTHDGLIGIASDGATAAALADYSYKAQTLSNVRRPQFSGGAGQCASFCIATILVGPEVWAACYLSCLIVSNEFPL